MQYKYSVKGIQNPNSTKNHRILLTNSRIPPETKYTSKTSLTETTYTKLRKNWEKKCTVEMKKCNYYL